MQDFLVDENLKKKYDDYYEEGDSEWRWLVAMDKANNIISLCKNHPHNSILEIGAGEGSILKWLSELMFGKELYGLEISTSGVETIQKKQIKSLIECKLFDGYNISYENNKFDLAILSHVLEHIEYPRKLIYEASRIAKYVFIEVPLEDTMCLSHDFVPNTPPYKFGHINFYTPKTIRILIQTCNLDILSQNITNPSRRAYIYQSGNRGVIKYFVKESLLKLVPRIAINIFTYHSSLFCRKKNQHA